jgi:hypothetical protein
MCWMKKKIVAEVPGTGGGGHALRPTYILFSFERSYLKYCSWIFFKIGFPPRLSFVPRIWKTQLIMEVLGNTTDQYGTDTSTDQYFF